MFIVKQNRAPNQGAKENARFGPDYIDILCVSGASGLLGATSGCTVVELDLNEYTAGALPQVQKAGTVSTAGFPALGVVHWDSGGTVTEGAQCWVRVYGIHDYVDWSTGTATAIGDPVGKGAAAGEAAKVTSTVDNDIYGVCTTAGTGTVVGVFINNPSRLVFV